MKTTIFILFVSLNFYSIIPVAAQVEIVAQPNAGESTKSSSPYGFTEYRGKVLFGANDYKGGGLFITDGSEEGTYCVTHEAVPYRVYLGQTMVAFKGKIYFIGSDRMNTFHLWETDGTKEGTNKVIDFSVHNAYPRWLWVWGEKLVILDMYKNLWFADANMELSESFWSEDRTTYSAHLSGNQLLFHFLYEVYASDLTTGETKQILHTESKIQSLQFYEHKGDVYFILKLEDSKQTLHKLDLETLVLLEIKDWGGAGHPQLKYFKTCRVGEDFFNSNMQT